MSNIKESSHSEQECIFGRNVVLAFLEQASKSQLDVQNELSQLDKIFLAQGLQYDKRIEQIKHLAKEQAVPIVLCEKQQLDKLVGSQSRHQGVVARISQANALTLPEFLQSLGQLKDTNKNMLIAMADGIQDPHNLGAIIRTALAADAKGLIVCNRRSAGTTGTVAKASAGALAHLPIVKVKNLVNAIEELKKFGFWIAGLDAEAKENYFEHDLKLPLAVVIGGEGKGLSRLVAEHCDFLLRIPMGSKSESLNAGVAAGIVFYEYVRQKMCEEK